MKFPIPFLLALLIFAERPFPAAAQSPQGEMPQSPQSLNFRIAGSSVVDPTGASAGNIEALVVNPQTGQIEFALAATGYPNDRTMVTPIPWQMLRYQTDARAAGGIAGTFQKFTVPVTADVLRQAPRFNSSAVVATPEATWRTASSSYFAPFAAATGIGAPAGGQGVQGGTANGANLISSNNAPAFNTNGFAARTNTFLPTNHPPQFTNQPPRNGATNSTIPPQTVLPPDTTQPGAVPGQPGTLPTQPDISQPNGSPPDGNVPRKAPLAPARPAAPVRR